MSRASRAIRFARNFVIADSFGYSRSMENGLASGLVKIVDCVVSKWMRFAFRKALSCDLNVVEFRVCIGYLAEISVWTRF